MQFDSVTSNLNAKIKMVKQNSFILSLFPSNINILLSFKKTPLPTPFKLVYVFAVTKLDGWELPLKIACELPKKHRGTETSANTKNLT